jgi:hypothetical protein
MVLNNEVKETGPGLISSVIMAFTRGGKENQEKLLFRLGFKSDIPRILSFDYLVKICYYFSVCTVTRRFLSAPCTRMSGLCQPKCSALFTADKYDRTPVAQIGRYTNRTI